MAFDNVTEFLAMGTHGLYVWSAYGVSILALLLLTWNTLSQRHQIKKKLRKRFLRDKSN